MARARAIVLDDQDRSDLERLQRASSAAIAAAPPGNLREHTTTRC